jgi:uncharacterized membrane protein
MTSSRTGFGKQLGLPHKKLAGAFLLVSALGFIDATYLTVKHYQGALPTRNFLQGCDSVLTSDYATIGSMPISLAGSLYYLTIFLLVFGYFDTGRFKLLWIAAQLTWTGFIVSLGLIYLQAVVIRSWCDFCMFSAAASLVLFGLGLAVLQKSKSAPQASH